MIRFKIRSAPTVKMRVGTATVVPSGGNPYEGPYEVVPKVEAQTLHTKQKYMTQNVTVLSVPFYEADNQNGTTIYIASEV